MYIEYKEALLCQVGTDPMEVVKEFAALGKDPVGEILGTAHVWRLLAWLTDISFMECCS
jgi:hypothetical protein